MQDRAEKLKRELAAHRRRNGSQRARTPTELKRRILAFADEARSAGWGWQEIAEAVGVHRKTFGSWRSTAGATPATSMIPVEIVDDGSVSRSSSSTDSRRSVSVVSPSGWRVEGLDVASAATLLRSLS